MTWFIVFFGYVISIGAYGLLCFMMQQSKSTPPSGLSLATLRPILYAAAGGCLLASIADACAILGLMLFLMGAPITEFALLAVASVVVMLVFILPKGISYWAAWEVQQKSSSDPFQP